MADLLALVCDVYGDFVTLLFGNLGQVWNLIVSILDSCCLSKFLLKSTSLKFADKPKKTLVPRTMNLRNSTVGIM